MPSNLLLERFGARRWIARIMVSWAVVAVAMAFVRGLKEATGGYTAGPIAVAASLAAAAALTVLAGTARAGARFRA